MKGPFIRFEPLLASPGFRFHERFTLSCHFRIVTIRLDFPGIRIMERPMKHLLTSVRFFFGGLLMMPLFIGTGFAEATPDLATAIARGNVEEVKRHIEEDPGSLNPKDPKARAPLDLAILRKNEEISLLLIEKGADPSRADASKNTPLHHAVNRNLPAVITALLKAGAKPNERDKGGWTPLHLAAAKSQLETTRALLAGGADPMTLSDLGGTPLHEAAVGGGRELIEALLEAKVDRKSTRLNSSHTIQSRMPSSA